MVQIVDIQAPQRKPSFAQLLGSGIGQGIGEGVSMGISHKLNQMLEEKKFDRDLTKSLLVAGYKQDEIDEIKQRLHNPQANQALPQQQPYLEGTQLQQILKPGSMSQLPAGVGPMLQQYMPAVEEEQMLARQMPQNAPNSPQVERSMIEAGNEAPVELTPEALRREENAIKKRYAKELERFREGSDLWTKVKSKEASELNQLKQSFTAGSALRESATKKERLEWEKKQKIIDRAEKKTEDYRKNMVGRSESLDPRKRAIEMSREAIQRGNVNPFSLGHIASLLGVPEAAGTDAGQLMAANKTHLLAALKPIGGRYNVFLEQQMAGAYPLVGRTKEGNLIAVDAADAAYEADKAYVDAYNIVKDRYENDPNYGYFPEKAEAEIDKMIKPKLEEIRNKMFLRFQEDREIDIPEKEMAQRVEKQMTETPLTHKRAVGIMTKAKDDLTRSLRREPTEDEVVKYFEHLVKKNNYFRVEE